MANSKMKKRSPIIYWIVFAFLMLDALMLIGLYSWGLLTSFKTTNGFLKNMLMPTWPWEWDFTNYITAFSLFKKAIIVDGSVYYIGITGMFYNTIVYCLITTTVGTLTQWMMAYLVGRFKCKMTDIIYKVVIVLMMIPVMGTLPACLAFRKALNLYDNWIGTFAWSVSWGGMTFLIFHTFIRNVAMDTIEAARIDGANNLLIMCWIVFPQTINAVLIMYTTSFISAWNDYMTMVIWMPSYPNLAYGVYSFSTSNAMGASLPPIQCAGSMLLGIPVFIAFIALKDKILGGVNLSIAK